MAVSDRDPHTGKLTTGHDWDGIKELDTPIPKLVLIVLSAGIVFLLIWTTLMPAWPTLSSYTTGLLGVDQRDQVSESVADAANERAAWTERLLSSDYSAIQSDAGLMQIVREAGATIFGDNCAACHGTNAQGGPGFPNLAEAPMLWGDSIEAIAETIRVGINSGHDETRFGQMLAFGRDQMLERDALRSVVTYVRGLSDPTVKDEGGAGAQIFADNCASCHGENAKGMTDTGAPDLTDAFWTYGGDQQSITASVFSGRQGHMPHWEGRLSAVDLKLVALYVSDLRGATP